jgi:hypothetical protein
MKLFDIVGSKVVIHEDALGIPCFKTIWEKYKDKRISTNIISYIILNNHPSSPYVMSMPKEGREKKLRNELLGEDIPYDDDFKYAEESYIEFTDTLILKMLRGIRTNIEYMSDNLQTVNSEGMNMRDMKDLLDLASKAEKAVKSIYSLEKQVRKEELETSSVRGGSEIGRFELPNKR